MDTSVDDDDTTTSSVPRQSNRADDSLVSKAEEKTGSRPKHKGAKDLTLEAHAPSEIPWTGRDLLDELFWVGTDASTLTFKNAMGVIRVLIDIVIDEMRSRDLSGAAVQTLDEVTSTGNAPLAFATMLLMILSSESLLSVIIHASTRSRRDMTVFLQALSILTESYLMGCSRREAVCAVTTLAPHEISALSDPPQKRQTLRTSIKHEGVPSGLLRTDTGACGLDLGLGLDLDLDLDLDIGNDPRHREFDSMRHCLNSRISSADEFVMACRDAWITL